MIRCMLDDVPSPNAVANESKAGTLKTKWLHIFVMVGSLATGSAATVTVLDSWQKVLADLGLRKSEAIVLAEQSARGDLVRQMTHLVSQRLFWIVRYSGDVAAGFPKEDQDEAWRHYNDSVIGWDETYMTNILLTEKYFGTETKKQLMDIGWMLLLINNCLNRIHYRVLYEAKDPACHFDGITGGTQEQNIAALDKRTEQVNQAYGTFINSLAAYP